MNITNTTGAILSETVGTLNSQELLGGMAYAILILIAGVTLGKISTWVLKKLSKKLDFEKSIQSSFIRLIISVIRWSIYVVFINWAIMQIKLPGLTGAVSGALIVVPALVGALILISLGFAVAVYLREVIEDAEVKEWKTISMYLYYFILFVSGVYALNLALVSIPFSIRGWILVFASVIISSAVGYKIIKVSQK